MNFDGGSARPHSLSEPPILKSETSLSVQCRCCGVRIPAGGAVFVITTVPASLEYVFRGGIFCSEKCIRAFCRESLEILDVLDAPSSKAMVIDLHEPHREVAKTLVTVLGK